MDSAKLKLIIAEGEGLSVEFKEKFTSKIGRDIVAFTNAKGGMIIIGVNDKGVKTGEKLTNGLKAQIHSIARNCEPPVTVDRISQVDGTVVVEIPEGDEKPYSCADGYFKRFDAVTQKMNRSEIKHLFQGSGSSFEERVHPDVSWGDIASDKIRRFLKEAKVALRNVPPKQLLESLNLAKTGGVKNAGVMFFAKDPRHHILQCQATLVAFKGTDRVHIYDRSDVQDDLLTQFNEAMIFLRKHLNIRSEIKGINRQDICEIPIEALREAVANAVIHRDYSVRGTSLMVEVHEDRVVISNPGALPAGYTPEKLMHVSIRRNELIADMFARMDKAERAGTGFLRMKQIMEDAGQAFPQIKNDHFCHVIFKRPAKLAERFERAGGEKVGVKVGERVGEKVTDNQRKILKEIGKNPYVGAKELSARIGISQRKVEENIRKLKQRNFIERIGPDRGGHWKVLK